MKKNIISNVAVFTVIAMGASYDASAGVRIGNKSRTYADAYSQVNDMENQRVAVVAPVASTSDVQNTPSVSPEPATGDAQLSLPIRVANPVLAQRIASGDTSAGVTVNDLERCSMIYPGGEFAWDTPSAGLGRGTAQKCVAVVEMRALNAAPDGSDLVLARANVAAGDSVRCNISDFPEFGYTDAISDFIFPADNPPTTDDVKKVMDAEQKQNAGLKIAAGALIGALGGNMTGKNDVGKESLLGTDKDKMQNSVIGALAGAAVVAGSSYAGKVGGDMILSTGINAAAGGIMANAMATGDSVLRIEECTVDGKSTTCLWGYVMKTKKLDEGWTDKSGEPIAYYNITDNTTVVCTSNDDNKLGVNCKTEDLVNIKLDKYPGKDIHEVIATNFNLILEDEDAKFYLATGEGPTANLGKYISENGTGAVYAKISSAEKPGQQYPAMIPDVQDSTFGLKANDWNNKIKKSGKTPIGRGTNGVATAGNEFYKIENFHPIYRSSEDGGIIDLNNKSRLKATATGAGVGGALGAFSAYQGAQSDIDERWVTAMREYEDSLGKVVCFTGTRYLTPYNGDVVILNMP